MPEVLTVTLHATPNQALARLRATGQPQAVATLTERHAPDDDPLTYRLTLEAEDTGALTRDGNQPSICTYAGLEHTCATMRRLDPTRT